jgi:hypothetical protein
MGLKFVREPPAQRSPAPARRQVGPDNNARFSIRAMVAPTGAGERRDQGLIHYSFDFHRSHLHGLYPGTLAKNGAQGNDFLGLIRSPERRDEARRGGANQLWAGFGLESGDGSCSASWKQPESRIC